MNFSRNNPCSCGSGFKFKHCCGALSPHGVRPPTAELELLIIEADDEGLRAGEEPKQRAFMNALRVLERLGVTGVALTGSSAPPIVKRVQAANDRLFRTKDKREGGVHLGFFMFRDLFCQLYVPIIFGSPEMDFLEFVDLSEDQKILMSKDTEAFSRFYDQAFDLYDFAYGFLEFGHSRPASDRAKDLIYRAHTHLEAAAATATSAYDFRGTLQSALLGTELALKAGLACNGFDDQKLREEFGHNLVRAASALQRIEPSFDAGRVTRAVSSFPHFVSSRYTGPQPNRIETGHILMKAQYVASEVTRLFTDRNVRKDQPAIPLRSYPQ